MSERNEMQGEWDEEFARVFSEIKELRGAVTQLSDGLISLEKRMLLRLRGNLNCRLCNASLSLHDAARLNPPLSELERKFHNANHGHTAHPDKSRGVPGFSPALDWDELERELERYNKAKR